MRIPPWLAGLLMVLVLATLWWALAWDVAPSEPAPATAPSAAARPSQSPSPAPSPSPPAELTPDDPGWLGPTGIDTRPWDGIDACEDDVLPATMMPVVEDILVGGPYDHPDRDGTRFGNYEGYLPDEERGYYREFTVQTPGLDHRGARRIVTGGLQETDPEVWYYTADHYESFCEFAP